MIAMISFMPRAMRILPIRPGLLIAEYRQKARSFKPLASALGKTHDGSTTLDQAKNLAHRRRFAGEHGLRCRAALVPLERFGVAALRRGLADPVLERRFMALPAQESGIVAG